MEIKKGLLDKKHDTYYNHVNIVNYRAIICQAIKKYEGKDICKVLDIGAGVGWMGCAVKPLKFEYHGLEGSKRGLQKCMEKGVNCKKFFLEKGKKIPYRGNSISIVIMNQVIEHLPQKTGQYYIKEIMRVLENGGVGIIKSPSKYSTIWDTDPHHIYCWKPNELYKEIKKYKKDMKNVELERVALEPWMFFHYNEKIIDDWHKKVKFPIIKRIFSMLFRVLDKFAKLVGSDRFLAASNIIIVKK